jgi:uncharacterized membrane protein YjfL (UPF0719 family)
MDLIYWDHYYNGVLLLNLAVVMALFVSLKLFSGAIIHVDSTRELSVRDNPAFGISLSAAMLGVAIMLGGAVYGDPDETGLPSWLDVAAFGLTGIVLLTITRFVLSKIVLTNISLRQEILGGNKAVAIADAGNVIAASIIIYVVMKWVPAYTLDTVMALLGGFAVSQAFLALMTVLRIRVFARFGYGGGLQDQLKQGNMAVALKFAGQKIGTALAMSTAAQIVVYEEYTVGPILLAWAIASVIVVFVWEILCQIAQRIILFRVDLQHEVINDKNIAIGSILAAIYISLGLLISQI